VIMLAAAEDRDPSVLRDLSEVAPTVVYDSDVPDWADATEAISDAYGRPRAGGALLLDVIDRARATDAATTPRDTQVSLLSVTGEGQDGVVVQRPDTLGSLMLEAVNARRPPAQRTRDGERVPPAPESPARGDELDGDVTFAVVGGGPRSEARAREAFGTDRWQDLDAVRARGDSVVDRQAGAGAALDRSTEPARRSAPTGGGTSARCGHGGTSWWAAPSGRAPAPSRRGPCSRTSPSRSTASPPTARRRHRPDG